jgi:hypothetical protein
MIVIITPTTEEAPTEVGPHNFAVASDLQFRCLSLMVMRPVTLTARSNR